MLSVDIVNEARSNQTSASLPKHSRTQIFVTEPPISSTTSLTNPEATPLTDPVRQRALSISSQPFVATSLPNLPTTTRIPSEAGGVDQEAKNPPSAEEGPSVADYMASESRDSLAMPHD